MLDLNRFYVNPFDDPQISDHELRTFTEDHIAKVQAVNTEGEFDGMLTDTGGAFSEYFGNVSSEDIKLALQKSSTTTMNSRWKDFVNYMVDRGEARIADRAGRGSAIYIEFFPVGKTEYHDARIADAHVLAARVKSSADSHAAELGEDFQSTIGVLVDGFTNARNAQVNLKGSKTAAAEDRRVTKSALALQLFDNLLVLARRHKGDPDKAALYFNQSLLEDPNRATEEEEGDGQSS